jgi:hypothetical protein
VTIGRNVPLARRDGRQDNHVFLKNGSDLFLRGALERGDHVEAVWKIGFSARVVSRVRMAFADDDPIKIDQGDLPDGQNRLVDRKRAKISAVG